jgi:hydroxylaminobenzene mutase
LDINIKYKYSRNLIRYGIILFILGLITGFLIPALENPRMGLSSHLEGTLNGMLLVIFGVIWVRLNLSDRAQKYAFNLALFGTYINWFTTLMAALWGAGSEMMPIAGGGLQGSDIQEILIKIGLISLSIAILASSGIILYGTRGNEPKY